MIFARETYSESLIAEMLPLWKEHAMETLDQNAITLDPNLDAYEQTAAMGILRAFTMRVDDVLVGYQVFFVSPHHHSKHTLAAQMDILYVSPAFRKGFNGYRFIKWCDQQLSAEGIEITYKSVKARRDVGHLLERLGYQLEDLTYSKRLREVS